MKYCIATPMKPLIPGQFQNLTTLLKGAAAEGGNTLQGLVIMPGNGCWNWGIMVSGPDEIGFMDALTISLQPAKYSRAPDDDPAVSEGVFQFIQE